MARFGELDTRAPAQQGPSLSISDMMAADASRSRPLDEVESPHQFAVAPFAGVITSVTPNQFARGYDVSISPGVTPWGDVPTFTTTIKSTDLDRFAPGTLVEKGQPIGFALGTLEQVPDKLSIGMAANGGYYNTKASPETFAQSVGAASLGQGNIDASFAVDVSGKLAGRDNYDYDAPAFDNSAPQTTVDGGIVASANFGSVPVSSDVAGLSVRGREQPQEVYDAIDRVARQIGVSPQAVAAVVEVESKFDPRTSFGSYKGATQLSDRNLRSIGVDPAAYGRMSLAEQIGVYGDYLKSVDFVGKMAQYGVDPGKLSPDQQFAALMGAQFAPERPDRWAKGIAEGNLDTVVTPTRQADELGGVNPTIRDLMAGFESVSSRVDISQGASFGDTQSFSSISGTPSVPSAFARSGFDYGTINTAANFGDIDRENKALASRAAGIGQVLGDAAYGRDPASVIARDGRPIDPFGTGYVTERTVSLAPADSKRAEQMKGWAPEMREFMDKLAVEVGDVVPELTISSAFRSQQYNQELREKGIRAAKNSKHISGLAFDAVGLTKAQENAVFAASAKIAREMGRGVGVGTYSNGSIHVDIGRPQGQVAAWGPRANEIRGIASAPVADLDRYVKAAADPSLALAAREQFDRERLANQQAALAAISDEITQIAQGRAPIDAPAATFAPAPAVANTRAVSMPQGSDFTRSMPSFGSLPSMSSPFDALSAPHPAARGRSAGSPSVSFNETPAGYSQPNFGPAGPFDRSNAMPANASDYGTSYSGPGISFGGATPSMADYGLGDRSMSGQFGQLGQSTPSPVGRGFAGSPEVAANKTSSPSIAPSIGDMGFRGSPEVAANKAGSFSPSAPQAVAPTPGSVAAQEAARPSAAPASGNVSAPVGRGFAGSPEVAANKSGLPSSITGDITMGFAQAPPAFDDVRPTKAPERPSAFTISAPPVALPVAKPAPPAAPPTAPPVAPPVTPPTRPPVAPPQAPRTTVAPVAPIAPPQPAFDPAWGVTGLAPSVMKDLSGLGLGAPPEGYQYGWSPMGSPAMVHANAPDYAKIAATGPGILGAIMGPEFGRITSQPSAPVVSNTRGFTMPSFDTPSSINSLASGISTSFPTWGSIGIDASRFDGATVTEGEGGSFKSVTLSGFDGVGGGAGNAGDNGPGSAKIVCSAMNRAYGFGSFRNAVWLRHSANLDPAYERGYHILFKPLIRFGYGGKSWSRRFVRGTLEHIARHRTADIWKQSRGKSRDWIGAAWRMILEPCCYAVGKLAEAWHDRHQRLFHDR